MSHERTDRDKTRIMGILIGYALILVVLVSLAGIGALREWNTLALWALIAALTSAATLAFRHVAVAVQPAPH